MATWTDECFSEIQQGDKVWYQTPQGQTFTVKDVIFGPHGWVLNAGGRHGMAKVVQDGANYLGHKPGRNITPDHLGKWLHS